MRRTWAISGVAAARLWARAVCVGAALGMAAPCALAQRSPAGFRAALGWASQQAGGAEVLGDRAAPGDARAAAAARLLADGTGEGERALRAALAGWATDSVGAEAVLRAVSEMPVGPAWLPEALAPVLGGVGDELRAGALRALGSVRTRDAVRLLLGYVGAEQPDTVRRTACAALARLTGRSDMPPDGAAWREWFATVEWLPEPEWRRVLAEGLATGADAGTRRLDAVTQRLVEVRRSEFRRLTSGEDRASMLLSLLADDVVALRLLGLRLITQELSNARLPDGSVSAGVLRLLRDTDPSVRALAADVTVRLAPEGAGSAVAGALVAERDPGVAVALLQATARWPVPQVSDAVARWLEEPSTAVAAIEAGAAMLGAGVLPSAADVGRLAAAVRRRPLSTLSAAALGVLLDTGDAGDRAAVGALLRAGPQEGQLAAAEAFAARAVCVDPLLDAAAEHPVLFGYAVRAVAAHRPTAEGYRAVRALPAPTPELRTDAAALIAARLSARELLRVARREPSPAARDGLLGRLTDMPMAPVPGVLSASSGLWRVLAPDPDRVAGLLLLVETRLELAQPAGALSALDVLGAVRGFVDPVAVEGSRTVALLWLNRIPEADALAAPASAWLDGLERAGDLPHAGAIADAIERRFGAALTSAERARLRALRARGASAAPAR